MKHASRLETPHSLKASTLRTDQQVYPYHSALASNGATHLSSCPFLLFFLKISVSRA